MMGGLMKNTMMLGFRYVHCYIFCINSYCKPWLLGACACNFQRNIFKNLPYLLSSCAYIMAITGKELFIVIMYTKLFGLQKLMMKHFNQVIWMIHLMLALRKITPLFHARNHVYSLNMMEASHDTTEYNFFQFFSNTQPFT